MASRTYAERCESAERQLLQAVAQHRAIGLHKTTSNLFRSRLRRQKALLELRDFNHVGDIDAVGHTAVVEGAATYESLVEATLPFGLLPAVVPELKTITVGGAVSGLGIESSSFRFGLVHDTVEEMEVLLGNGTIVRCSRNTEPDLFFAIPNSYGTLGYVLRLKIRLTSAPSSIHLQRRKFTGFGEYFDNITQLAGRAEPDYLDGVMFSPSDLYVTMARACAAAAPLSDYTGMRAYYRSIPEKTDDWLSAKSYVWRWDTDWFWCSRQLYLDNPLLRFAMLPALGSKTYQRIMRLSNRLLPASQATESVIQDVQIPVEHAPEFAAFVLNEIGIQPVWICPFRTFPSERQYDLCPLRPDTLYINFGFWDVLEARGASGTLNRLVERKALDLGGLKALYSSSYYDEETFWSIYNKPRYDDLRETYHATAFPDLYSKCVLRV